MDQQTLSVKQAMEENKGILAPLLRYLPYLADSSGRQASSTYSGDGIGQHSVAFPVYDGTLLSFIREAQRSELMDRNYLYVYSRKGLKTHDQERRFILSADHREWDSLRGILSKYVLGGQTKATLWNEGVSEQIFYLVLSKMKELVEFWTAPDGR